MRPVFWVLAMLSLTAAWGQEVATSADADLEMLRDDIGRVLRETKTPGAGVAIVWRDGFEWVSGFGLADVASGTEATPDTLFRLGSITKSVVSLAVLKLVEEGRLDLQDTLRSRAPELEFRNPWEATDPVRMVHLLEHTAGWDDFTFRDYAVDVPDDLSLRDGLAYDPAIRTSRWRPGTRFSYSNAGPPAAAYVVERITGRPFEAYVREVLLAPLGMETANFFEPMAAGETKVATAYRDDGETPFPYWRILMRPAGSLNASARDMASYLRLYVNRGVVGEERVLAEDSIARMETPTSTYAARDGLVNGYGLGNYATVKERVYHGHNGGMMGALAEMAYLREESVGFAFMINSSNGEAFRRIGDLLRAFVTRDLPPLEEPPVSASGMEIAAEYAGWYVPFGTRMEVLAGFQHVTGSLELTVGPGGLKTRTAGGRPTEFVAVTDRTFRRKAHAAPTLALIADRSEGILLQQNGQTFRRVPAVLIHAERVWGIGLLVALVGALGFAMVWIPRWCFGKLRKADGIAVRVWPPLAALCLVAAPVMILIPTKLTPFASIGDVFDQLGHPTIWSVGLCVATSGFAVCAVLGLVQAWRWRRREMNRLAWWHAFLTSLCFTSVASYLAYWGYIGVRTWS